MSPRREAEDRPAAMRSLFPERASNASARRSRVGRVKRSRADAPDPRMPESNGASARVRLTHPTTLFGSGALLPIILGRVLVHCSSIRSRCLEWSVTDGSLLLACSRKSRGHGTRRSCTSTTRKSVCPDFRIWKTCCLLAACWQLCYRMVPQKCLLETPDDGGISGPGRPYEPLQR